MYITVSNDNASKNNALSTRRNIIIVSSCLMLLICCTGIIFFILLKVKKQKIEKQQSLDFMENPIQKGNMDIDKTSVSLKDGVILDTNGFNTPGEIITNDEPGFDNNNSNNNPIIGETHLDIPRQLTNDGRLSNETPGHVGEIYKQDMMQKVSYFLDRAKSKSIKSIDTYMHGGIDGESFMVEMMMSNSNNDNNSNNDSKNNKNVEQIE